MQHFHRPVSLLKRLAENDVIESVVGVILKTLVNVTLVDRNPPRDGPLHTAAGDLHTAGINTLILGQPLQQFTLAAAQVKHLRVGLDNLPNDGVVAAAKYLRNKCGFFLRFGRHCTFSYVLPRKPRMRSVCSATSTKNAS